MQFLKLLGAIVTALFIGVSNIGPTQAFSQGSGNGATEEPSFTPYLKRSLELLEAERSSGGYDINRAYSKDLDYGPSTVIKASRPRANSTWTFSSDQINPTMCVAAVAELIIEAINIYEAERGSDQPSAYTRLPADHWRKGRDKDLRSHLFRYAGSGSSGSADAFVRFGIGTKVAFNQLQPFDFVTFNRNDSIYSGHAVLFLSYLKADGESFVYDDKVIGFRYFSAQGKGRPDAGFGYRNAYFDGQCPSPRKPSDDCKIIKGFRTKPDGTFDQNFALMNTGRLLHPAMWDVDGAAAQRVSNLSRGPAIQSEAISRGIEAEQLAELILDRELMPDEALYVDGSSE